MTDDQIGLFDTPDAMLAALVKVGAYLGSPVAVHGSPRDTEVLAAIRMSKGIRSIRSKVLTLLALAGSDGMTGEECHEALGLNPYSVRPRLTELARHGLVEASGQRANSRGNPEVVWTLAATAQRAVAKRTQLRAF